MRRPSGETTPWYSSLLPRVSRRASVPSAATVQRLRVASPCSGWSWRREWKSRRLPSGNQLGIAFEPTWATSARALPSAAAVPEGGATASAITARSTVLIPARACPFPPWRCG